MNVLGIEYRGTYSVVSLREGVYRPQLIGDGRRTLIPNAVGPGRLWGSEAGIHLNETPAPGPWLADCAAIFWQQLQRRVVRFLGGLQPAEHGCDCVIACAGTAEESSAVALLASAAGLPDATVVTPVQAAIALWLAGQINMSADEYTVAVVAVGDATAEATVFAVRTGLSPTILDAASGGILTGTGAGLWANKLLREVAAHLPDPISEDQGLSLWQAALEFGEGLRRAGATSLIRWSGPLEDRMVSPFRKSGEDLFDWPEMMDLTHWLSPAVQAGTRGLGRDQVDFLLVCGLGANWPLPAKAFLGLPEPIISADPAADIAIGATWWPVLTQESLAIQSSELAPPMRNSDVRFHPRMPLPGGMSDRELARLLADELDERQE